MGVNADNAPCQLQLEPHERRLQRVLVVDSEESAVFAPLIEVRGIHNETRYPSQHGHELLRQLAQRVPELLRRVRRNGEPRFHVRIEGRQQNAVVGLDREYAIPGRQVMFSTAALPEP